VEVIKINYPEGERLKNKLRFEARNKFSYVDRVPVLLGICTRYLLHARGVGYKEYFSDPKTHLYHQLHNLKWAIENIPDDRCADPAWFWICADFENVVNAQVFGAEIEWRDDEPPRALPVIEKVEDIDRIKIPSIDTGLWGKRAQWLEEMAKLAKHEFKLLLNGQEVPINIAKFLIGGEGPFMTAVDLVGDKFYWWLYEYPEACHRLLGKITDAMIAAESEFRRRIGRRIDAGVGLAEDSSQIISEKQFREFNMPYLHRIYSTLGGKNIRQMHMCGQSSHLHEALLELDITEFAGFGSPVDPAYIAHTLGGKVLLAGNIDPVLLLNGPEEKIREAVRYAWQHLAPCGGWILQDGFNICPGTPIEHMAILKEEAEKLGLPEGAKVYRGGEGDA